MERSYSTCQARLPQELRLAQITTFAGDNAFLRQHYIAGFNSQFKVKAAVRGSTFRSCTRRGRDCVFSIQTERVVSKDNTLAIGDRWWQMPSAKCQVPSAKCQVPSAKCGWASIKEIELLGQFFKFCRDRERATKNPARSLSGRSSRRGTTLSHTHARS